MIKGKLAVAKTQERINKMGDSVNSANRSIASFEKYEDLANKKLDEANAMAELNRMEKSGDIRDLTAKYSQGSDVVQDRRSAVNLPALRRAMPSAQGTCARRPHYFSRAP